MATRFTGFLVSPPIYDLILYNLREGAQAGPRLRMALDQAIPRGELARVYGEPGLATAVPVDLHAPTEIDLAAIAADRLADAGLAAWDQPDAAADAAAIVAADRVLVELGWIVDRGARRRGTTNLRLPLTWEGSPGLASAAARAIRGGWKQLGITAPSVTAGWAYVLMLLRTGKFSVALARLAGGSDVDLSPWFHSRGAHNLTGIADHGLDAALDAYRQAGTRAARDAAKAAVAGRLAALRPVTVLHAPLQVMLVSRAVTGLEFIDDLPRLDRLGLAAASPPAHL
jgi:ABC-type oligopeptide transport system substrate-binding subunit